MTTTYSLNISSQEGDTSTNASITSESPEMLQRLLQLAGMQQSPGYVSSPDAQAVAQAVPQELPQQACDVCGEVECQCDHNVSEAADYDYSDQEVDDEGHPIDPENYVWQGAKEPQRIAQIGNNPLAETLFGRIKKQWTDFLAEADLSGEAGTESPLTDPTKPDFDKDPMSGEKPVTDGSRSPFSTVRRQKVEK